MIVRSKTIKKPWVRRNTVRSVVRVNFWARIPFCLFLELISHSKYFFLVETESKLKKNEQKYRCFFFFCTCTASINLEKLLIDFLNPILVEFIGRMSATATNLFKESGFCTENETKLPLSLQLDKVPQNKLFHTFSFDMLR